MQANEPTENIPVQKLAPGRRSPATQASQPSRPEDSCFSSRQWRCHSWPGERTVSHALLSNLDMDSQIRNTWAFLEIQEPWGHLGTPFHYCFLHLSAVCCPDINIENFVLSNIYDKRDCRKYIKILRICSVFRVRIQSFQSLGSRV